MKIELKEVMKTGYDQHFKKVKQTQKGSAFNIKTSKNPSKQKPKVSFPLMPLFSFLLVAGSGLLFVDNFDSIESYFKKIEISLATAQAEEPKAGATPAAPVVPADSQSLPVEAKKVDDADYLFKLAERKKQLDTREEELNKLAAQIEKQKIEVSEKLAKLEETRSKISTALEEKIKVDDVKVDTLVQMYSNMKPVQAAKVFETLDEDLVIEILGRMKKKNAADILNLIKPEKAQIFAERYTGYRAPASK
jgi:flagellar motility protein MotE (MotC chaperone)